MCIFMTPFEGYIASLCTDVQDHTLLESESSLKGIKESLILQGPELLKISDSL